MRRTLAAAGLAIVMLVACQPTEPSMTITAAELTPKCLNSVIIGKVTPANATSKVVLQRTVGGKWVDWKWYVGGHSPAALITDAPIADGTFYLPYDTEKPDGTPLTGTVHLRVRSSGGTQFSNGLYVKFPKTC